MKELNTALNLSLKCEGVHNYLYKCQINYR